MWQSAVVQAQREAVALAASCEKAEATASQASDRNIVQAHINAGPSLFHTPCPLLVRWPHFLLLRSMYLCVCFSIKTWTELATTGLVRAPCRCPLQASEAAGAAQARTAMLQVCVMLKCLRCVWGNVLGSSACMALAESFQSTVLHFRP